MSADTNAWPWHDSLDAVIAAPRHHRLMFENERVRILEVRIAPGELVPVHTHRWPSAIYVAKQSDFLRRDGHGNLLFDSRTAGPPSTEPEVQWPPTAAAFRREYWRDRDPPDHHRVEGNPGQVRRFTEAMRERFLLALWCT